MVQQQNVQVGILPSGTVMAWNIWLCLEETSKNLQICLCDIPKMAGQGDTLWAFEWIWLKAR